LQNNTLYKLPKGNFLLSFLFYDCENHQQAIQQNKPPRA